MTIYKPYAREAETAARMAMAAAVGEPYAAERFGEQLVERTNASGHRVPSVLLPVVAVTRDTVQSTVVADAVYTTAQICTPAFEAACRRAGLAP
jgi:D-xylose transport system substrate-binding protein